MDVQLCSHCVPGKAHSGLNYFSKPIFGALLGECSIDWEIMIHDVVVKLILRVENLNPLPSALLSSICIIH